MPMKLEAFDAFFKEHAKPEENCEWDMYLYSIIRQLLGVARAAKSIVGCDDINREHGHHVVDFDILELREALKALEGGE